MYGFSEKLIKVKLQGRPLPKPLEGKDFVTLEDETDRLSRNVGTVLPPYAA
jgi:hypothetical protein